MAITDTLDQIESLVAGATHVPLSSKCIIDENDLVHLIEELRTDLPQQLDDAQDVLRSSKQIIEDARQEAARIVERATQEAKRLLNQNNIVQEAEERAAAIIKQTQEEQREIMETARESSEKLRDDADAYAGQVFDQLIKHVNNTFEGVQQAEGGLRQALQVLVTARQQMSRPGAPEAMDMNQ